MTTNMKWKTCVTGDLELEGILVRNEPEYTVHLYKRYEGHYCYSCPSLGIPFSTIEGTDVEEIKREVEGLVLKRLHILSLLIKASFSAEKASVMKDLDYIPM